MSAAHDGTGFVDAASAFLVQENAFVCLIVHALFPFFVLEGIGALLLQLLAVYGVAVLDKLCEDVDFVVGDFDFHVAAG